MSLPALRAIRERFPNARITAAVGKPGDEVVGMSGYVDAIISVDRVRLRDGFKPLSILRIFQITRDVRRRQFDFVIDLHSLSETNVLGLFPGAGHPSRRWDLERFAELADFLVRNDDVRPIVFAGPEERSLVQEMRSQFPRSSVILERLTIRQLASAQARLTAFVSNDTGPMHIAAAVGTPVVVLLDRRAPESYLPLIESRKVIYNATISEITVEEVYAATRELLSTGRTA